MMNIQYTGFWVFGIDSFSAFQKFLFVCFISSVIIIYFHRKNVRYWKILYNIFNLLFHMIGRAA